MKMLNGLCERCDTNGPKFIAVFTVFVCSCFLISHATVFAYPASCRAVQGPCAMDFHGDFADLLHPFSLWASSHCLYSLSGWLVLVAGHQWLIGSGPGLGTKAGDVRRHLRFQDFQNFEVEVEHLENLGMFYSVLFPPLKSFE